MGHRIEIDKDNVLENLIKSDLMIESMESLLNVRDVLIHVDMEGVDAE